MRKPRMALADDHAIVRKGLRFDLMQKLSLHNTAELVLYAVRKRVIS